MDGVTWGQKRDGFAKGPDLVIMTGRGDAVTCSAVWSDEDGICVSVAMGDEVLTSMEARTVAAMLLRLADLPAPGDSSG